MTFFNINGWNVPIVNGGMSETSTPYGNSGKSFTNKQLIRRRMVPRSWTGSMLFQSPSVADTVEGLLMGRGHHFSFDRDFWRDSGVAPATLSDLNVFQGGGEQRFGTGYARFDGIALASVSFNVDFPTNKWTVIVWGDDAGGGDWHQYAEKANGDTYIDGELQDPALTSFVSVSDGVLTINQANFPTGAAVLGKKLDDLVLLPFNVDDSFIAELYAWQNANDVVMQCPFDYPGDFVDRVHGVSGTASSAVDIAAGDPINKSGYGSLLCVSPSETTTFPVAGGDPTELDNSQEQTVCFWVRPDVAALGAGVARVCSQGAGATSWIFDLNTGAMRAYRGVGAAFDDIDILDSSVLVDGEWAHFAAVYTTDGATTSSMSLYRNGAIVGSGSATFNAGSSTNDVVFGSALNGFTGNTDDFRYYKKALSASEIVDVYNQGFYGYDFVPPSGRAFSKLPRLLVSGDCIGSQHPKEVIGSVASEAYVQHGGPFSPNDRSIEISLEEVSPLREEGIPSPDGNFILSPEFIIDNNAAQVQRESCSGGYQYEDLVSAPTQVYDSDDSFGFCLDFDGVGDGILLPSDLSNGSNFATDLGGRSAVTVGAWFRTDSLGSIQYLISVPVDSSDDKLFLRITAAGDLHMGCQLTSLSGQQSLTTSGLTVLASNWYFVLGVIDLRSETIRIYGNLGVSGSEPNVRLIDSGSITASQGYFSSETDTSGDHESRIGIQSEALFGPVSPFDGKIKSVMVWKRALETDEIVATFRKGYERRIFR